MVEGKGGSPAPQNPADPQDKWAPLKDYLHTFEDGALTAGGLLATIAGSLGTSSNPNTAFVVLGLGFASIAKATPSLIADRLWTSATNPDRHPDLSALADAWLLFFGVASLVYYSLLPPTHSLTWFLGLVGVGFIGKAVIDIGHDFASAYPTRGGVAIPSSGPTEDLLFLVFGLASLLLAIPGWGTALATSPALGLAALGKALPSLLQQGSSDGQKTSGSGGGAPTPP